MRVITFSRKFPVKHPKAGEPTYFVEKILRGIHHISDGMKSLIDMDYWATSEPKWHTIRAGNRWKVGDFFSPRMWSGKPYASKQIEIAPPIKIKKIWPVTINFWQNSPVLFIDKKRQTFEQTKIIARNDGLYIEDFVAWFNCHPKAKDGFAGQILCWNESIEY